MDKKKPTKSDLIIMATSLTGLMAFVGLVICNTVHDCINDTTNTYVITDKGANKIEYYSIKNPADTHIMTFDGDTALNYSGWYPYLRVGDTISGLAIIMNDKVVKSTRYEAYRMPRMVTTIARKNGKTLPEWREIAMRDSLMQKQK